MGYLKNAGIALLIAVFIFVPALIGIYVKYLWFSEVSYLSVFLTVIKTKAAIFALSAFLFYVLAYANLKIAIKNLLGEGSTALSSLVLSLLFVLGILTGFIVSLGWEIVLLWTKKVQFGIADPLFGNDISFYFFTLPFYEYIQSTLLYMFGIVLVLVFVVYFLHSKPMFGSEPEYKGMIGHVDLAIPELSRAAKAHLSALAGAVFVLISAGYFLDRYSLLYSSGKTVFGAGYTDVHIRLYVITALALVALICALAFFAASFYQDLRLPLAAVGVLVFIAVFGSFAAGIMQTYKVEPDEFNLEKPYIERNIEFTLKAYNLDSVSEVNFPARYNLTSADIQKNNQTIDNIRLWDWQPLMKTYKQLQLIRTYYDFNDVDIDRYGVDGAYKQVMISAREINLRDLPAKSKTWINEHLVYTHGYGLTMSPVRYVSREGMPILYVKDVPPVSDSFKVAKPEIYYGEIATSYAVVNTTTKEFDYPTGEGNIYTVYGGSGGIALSSFTRRALMAMYFGEINLLVSESLTPSSRMLIYRSISERVNTIAPFLKYDGDPYIVLSDGKLYWIIDAYTVSDRYPYSEPYGEINYIRNSVKVAIDAYSGETSFYLVDENDPLIKTYRSIFPTLFKPFSSMPDDLEKHIRYPEDLFSVQAEKYAIYHMQNPMVFYNKEDAWDVPSAMYEGKRTRMEPYYLITKLPGEKSEEFIILLPFTPRGKDNMISWMAARSDMPKYGERVVYLFPKEKLVFGPMQIENRIDQDTEISQLFTLWSQVGSRVIRGNLLVIPVEDSLIYIEPVYLRAEQPGALPELKRVIVAFGDRLTMQSTLEDALKVIFEKAAEEKPEKKTEKTISELVEEAGRHYENAQRYLRDGNFSEYGAEIEALGEVLRELKGK